jgi:HK97 family phage portal protein
VARFMPALRGRTEVKQRGFTDYYAALLSAGLNIDAATARKKWSMERAIAEGYERIPWVYKATDAIARANLRTPFVVKENGTVVDDHPYYRLLNTGWANPLEPALIFRKRLVQQFLLSPRGVFVEETQSRAGIAVRFDLLSPGRTRIMPGTGADLIAYFETTGTDGVRRYVDPERVRWIRDPHPTDPFGAMTPLEAAGLSAELDYFTRLYNVSFMRNDGRPGGIVGIDAEMDQADMDRIESRFGKGPVEAGRLSVVSGALSFVDTGAKPRDMAYKDLSKNSKDEILAAYGTPESVIGNASGKTFANADAEAELFWSHTVVNTNALLAAGFGDNDNIETLFDHSGISEMQRALQQRRKEMRDEFTSGLRSMDEYREHTDDLDPVDNAFSRALFLPSGKTPVPFKPEDAEALGMGAPTDPNATDGGEADPLADADQGDVPVDAVAEQVPAPGAGENPQSTAVGGLDLNGDAVIPQYDLTVDPSL